MDDQQFDFAPPYTVYKDKYHLPILATIENVEEFHEMEIRHDDVFIVTYPKSGTHWMQELLHLIYADGDVSRVTAKQRLTVAEMVDTFNPETVNEKPPNYRLMENLPSPRVFTTHLPRGLLPKQIWRKKCKVIYVYRHPKDVICSFYNFHHKLYKRMAGMDVPDSPAQFDRFFRAVLAGEIEYGSWFDHILDYYPCTDEDFFLFISFEDMIQDIASVVRRVGAFIGKEMDERTVERIVDGSSFAIMKRQFEKDHQKHVEENSGKLHLDVFLNKGTTHQWQSRFTGEQNEEFDEVFQRRMKDCPLTKKYHPLESKL